MKAYYWSMTHFDIGYPPILPFIFIELLHSYIWWSHRPWTHWFWFFLCHRLIDLIPRSSNWLMMFGIRRVASFAHMKRCMTRWTMARPLSPCIVCYAFWTQTNQSNTKFEIAFQAWWAWHNGTLTMHELCRVRTDNYDSFHWKQVVFGRSLSKIK